MKKILLGLFTVSAVAMASELTQDLEKTNIYLRAGMDPISRFKQVSVDGGHLNAKDSKDLGFEVGVEATQTIFSNFELGLGVSYQDHGRPKAGNMDGIKLPSFQSVPVYVVGKYSIPTDTPFTPYLKADLGYSFNFGSKSYDIPENEKLKVSYKDGMYWGVGAGVEYNNLVVDLMYKMNYGKAKMSAPNFSQKSDIDYGRVTLGVGYKFNF